MNTQTQQQAQTSNFSLLSTVRYDTDIAQIYYNEFIAEYEPLLLGNRSVNYMVVGDMDAPAFKVSHLRKQSKDELIQLWRMLGMEGYGIYTKAEIIDDLMIVDARQYYTAIYNNKSWHDLPSDFTACGFSQGDAVSVLVIGKDYEFVTKEYVHNLFYATPIHGSIELYYGDKEVAQICVDEYIHQYNGYDKSDFISEIEKQYKGLYKEALFERLNDALPTELNYH